MKNYKYLLITALLFYFSNSFSQCNIEKTIIICDMTQIDFDNDGNFDGIINLYDEYNALLGVTPIANNLGEWFDPDYNFVLDASNGNLHLWDLNNSSENNDSYQFQLLDTSSGCPGDLVISLNVVVGAFSGFAVPTTGANAVNVEICDAPNEDGCFSSTSFDLYQTFLPTPHAHSNGIWSYEGNSSNFLGIELNRYLVVDIPYQEGPPLVDEEIFELIYTVPGITPCATSVETRVKVSVIRGVFSGASGSYDIANMVNICETELIAGDFDNIDLRDDAYLVGEDIEGVWLVSEDPTGQITTPIDSQVNLGEVYQDLIATNPRFRCKNYFYTYRVYSRPNVCFDTQSTVSFLFFESIRPFEQEVPEEICLGTENLTTLDLYDLITFTTENNVLYDYPQKKCTNWRFVSGPSNLGLVSNTDELCEIDPVLDASYTTRGTIDISNLTSADVGTYVFEYNVLSSYNCEVDDFFNFERIFQSPDGCTVTRNTNHPCESQTAQVTLIVHPYNYPGEDTLDLEFCESDMNNPLDLKSLLNTNGVDTIYQGADYYWVDLDTNENIPNPFTIPDIDGERVFNLQYNITANNCLEQANLTFTVSQQYNAGSDGSVDVCIEDSNFELFDSLGSSPDENGTWSGPNGFTSASNLVDFDPATFETGNYIYTVPSNGICNEHSATVTVNIHALSNAGNNVQETICKLDNQIDLFNLLDSDADTGGTFIDLDNTNALSGSIVDLTQLINNSYSFQYDVQINTACALSSSVITISVVEVEKPIIIDQEFCIGYGANLNDLEINSSNDTYNWYDNIADTTTLDSTLTLRDGEDYFVAAVDDNGCESERVKVTVTLIEFGKEGCVSCINDGVSANDDGENDALGLCDLPSIFPNFEIKIFNRYGNTIYTGNANTTLFDGTSNVALTLGDKVSAGVYFYIFDPKDGITKPFQGDFYLSR